jgi:hypothetical protein
VTFGPTTALAMAGAPFPLFHRVIGLGVGAPATEGVVGELLDDDDVGLPPPEVGADLPSSATSVR